HGPSAGFARAYWTRLYARAFFFCDTAGHPLILVSADLFALPGGLAERVTRSVVTRWAQQGLAIPRDAIIIAATHTHQSPDNVMTARVYNQFGSKYDGFDRELFEFLERQVTAAIDSAIGGARTSGVATLEIATGAVSDSVLMNRSPHTYLANWNAQALMDALNPSTVRCTPRMTRGEAASTGWDLPGCPRLRATDRSVTVLNIRRGADIVGELVFLSSLPAVLEHSAPVYRSDFTGVAV